MKFYKLTELLVTKKSLGEPREGRWSDEAAMVLEWVSGEGCVESCDVL
jgi:hypothetical protein